MLTKEDKIQIINAHSKSLNYSKYNLQIDKIQENSKTAPDSASIEVIDAQISDIDKQLAALDSELTAVNSLTE